MPQTLVCRRCKVPPELVREEGQGDIIRCPQCGVFGDKEEAIRAAAQEVQRGMIDGLQNTLTRRFSRSKTVRYIPDKRPQRVAPSFVFREDNRIDNP